MPIFTFVNLSPRLGIKLSSKILLPLFSNDIDSIS